MKGWVLIFWESVRYFVRVHLPIDRILLLCVKCVDPGRIGLHVHQPHEGRIFERFHPPCSSEIQRFLPGHEIEFLLFGLVFVGSLCLSISCQYRRRAYCEFVLHSQSLFVDCRYRSVFRYIHFVYLVYIHFTS